MKAGWKSLITLLSVIIVCFALSPAAIAAPVDQDIGLHLACATEIVPLQGGNRTIQEIAQDPTVSAAIEAAWADSQAGNYTTRHEEGGWIYECMEGELIVYEIERWPAGNRSSIKPSPPNPPAGCRLVGHFHTHPNPPVDEAGTKWEQGASESDKNYANKIGVPGIIRNVAGTVFFGPGS